MSKVLRNSYYSIQLLKGIVAAVLYEYMVLLWYYTKLSIIVYVLLKILLKC